MKKQVLMAVGVAAMLGAAVSGAFSKDNQSAATVRAEAVQPKATAADKLLARLNASPASVPLARPL
jgi:hypothetical protein